MIPTMPTRELYVQGTQERQGLPWGFRGLGLGMSRQVHYGVLNKGRLGSGVPHREPSVLHVTVEAVAGDLGASQASSQLTGEGGEAEEGKSSCRMPRIGVARGERGAGEGGTAPPAPAHRGGWGGGGGYSPTRT